MCQFSWYGTLTACWHTGTVPVANGLVAEDQAETKKCKMSRKFTKF